MNTKDLLKLSTRMFTARRGRTALTVLGMGIGFGAILFLVSLGYGLQGALLETITSSGALTTLDVSPNDQEGKILTAAAADEMKSIDGVEAVEPSYNFNARIKFGDVSSDARAIVASPGYFSLDGLKIAAGKALDPPSPPTGGSSEAGKNNSKEILVSSAFGKILGKNSDELVGQKISFSLFVPVFAAEGGKEKSQSQTTSVDAGDYTVSGVIEGEETIFYALQGDFSIPPEVTFAKIKVKCKSGEVLAPAREAITQKGFSVSSLSETVAEVNKLFRFVNIALGFFGIITLAVSAIGMFNTMTVALLERTREIGIMRSIGASKSDILFMFIIESTLMGFCGGIAGIVFGIASGQIVNLIVNIAAKYFGGKPLDLFAYPLWFLGFLLLFSVIIGFATGIGPAKRASALDPLEALRSR
jgi:putative ABC transport system permease protein